MSHNIIIITKDNDQNYRDPNNPLGKFIIHTQEKILLKASYLAAFQELTKLKPFAIANKYGREYYTPWVGETTRENELKISDVIIELLNKVKCEIQGDERLYDIITLDNGNTVYLLYWNLLGTNKFNAWHCIPLICMDCGININDSSQKIPILDRHILYIHDDEWGKKGNLLLMKNSEPKEETVILHKLKDYFQYIAAFMHNNKKGYYFNSILNCIFGEDSISDKLGELEDNKSFSDYIKLKQEMMKVL